MILRKSLGLFFERAIPKSARRPNAQTSQKKLGFPSSMGSFALWFNQVEQWNCEEFNTVIKTFQNHYDRILNFFNDKRTNASAESFNCKLKTFRAEFRGVNDLKFYLYRVKQLFA